MEDRIFVVLAPVELTAPAHGMAALGPGPVMQNLFGGAIESYLRIAADAGAAVGHADRNVVRGGVNIDAEVTDGLVEVADGLTHQVHAGDLAVNQEAGVDDEVV